MYRITYISNIDCKASTRTYRESTHGRESAHADWNLLVGDSGSRWTLCAVMCDGSGRIMRKYRID
jgi:hypothetical protein